MDRRDRQGRQLRTYISIIEVNWCQPPYIFESANSSTECSGNFGYLRLIINFRTFRGHKSMRKNRLTTWKELRAAETKFSNWLNSCDIFSNYNDTVKYKLGCVFPIVAVSVLPFPEFGRNHHWEDAEFHFRLQKFDFSVVHPRIGFGSNFLYASVQTFQIKPYCRSHYLMLLNSNSIFYTFLCLNTPI